MVIKTQIKPKCKQIIAVHNTANNTHMIDTVIHLSFPPIRNHTNKQTPQKSYNQDCYK